MGHSKRSALEAWRPPQCNPYLVGNRSPSFNMLISIWRTWLYPALKEMNTWGCLWLPTKHPGSTTSGSSYTTQPCALPLPHHKGVFKVVRASSPLLSTQALSSSIQGNPNIPGAQVTWTEVLSRESTLAHVLHIHTSGKRFQKVRKPQDTMSHWRLHVCWRSQVPKRLQWPCEPQELPF